MHTHEYTHTYANLYTHTHTYTQSRTYTHTEGDRETEKKDEKRMRRGSLMGELLFGHAELLAGMNTCGVLEKKEIRANGSVFVLFVVLAGEEARKIGLQPRGHLGGLSFCLRVEHLRYHLQAANGTTHTQ
jgi:hypothetical protein